MNNSANIPQSGGTTIRTKSLSPAAAAVTSKLNKEGTGLTRPITSNDMLSSLSAVSASTKSRIENTKDILQLFPDLEVAMQIIESSILSPNDMATNATTYMLKTMKLPSDIHASVVNLISNRLEKTYELSSKLPKIIRESMFLKGAYIEMIIPEVAADDIIHNRDQPFNAITSINTTGNISREEQAITQSKTSKTLGLINVDTITQYRLATEDISIAIEDEVTAREYTNLNKVNVDISQEDLGISITDAIWDIRSTEDIKHEIEHLARNRINITRKKHIATESNDINKNNISNLFRQQKSGLYKDVVKIPTKDNASRRNIGRPSTVQLPTEYVIPVHVLTDPSKHVGYFVMLDERTGMPIDTNLDDIARDSSNLGITTASDSKLGLINKAKTALMGLTKSDTKITNIEELYSKLVENMIVDSFKNSGYDNLVEIEKNTDLTRVMLFRALRGQKTKMLFVPSELMVYYAFEYRDNGTGKSRLEKLGILFTIRAVLMFTKIMASIKNSTTNTVVKATLDESDPDPQKSRNMIISEALKTRQMALPLGFSRIDDLVNWAHSAGFVFDIKGEGLPNMEISTEERGANKIIPDSTLDEDIQENILMALGVTAEMVKSGYNADFATTIVSRNLLFSKRIGSDQKVLMPMIADHCNKLLYNDDEFLDDLTELLYKNIDSIIKNMSNNTDEAADVIDEETENKTDLSDEAKKELALELAGLIVDDIGVDLPQPEENEAQAMKAAFDSYKQVLEDYTDAIFSSTTITSSLAGELSNNIEDIKVAIKSSILKNWMAKNKYMPELSEIITMNDENVPIIKGFEDHVMFIENLIKAMNNYADKIPEMVKNGSDVSSKISGSGADSTGTDDGGYGADQGTATTDEGGTGGEPDNNVDNF